MGVREIIVSIMTPLLPAPHQAPRVLRLPANTSGRDFVVGDIHGAFTLLDAALEHIAFDPQRDRLLSVGDLIDRGPNSYAALEFLSRPGVYAVRGNHEQMFCECNLAQIRKVSAANHNGTAWIVGLSDTEVRTFQDQFSRLPIAIEVETSAGKVGLVHADVPREMCWEEFTTRIELGSKTSITTALYGRKRIETFRAEGVRGISKVFVGHSIVWDAPLRLGNIFAIDTGASECFESAYASPQRGLLTLTNAGEDAAQCFSYAPIRAQAPGTTPHRCALRVQTTGFRSVHTPSPAQAPQTHPLHQPHLATSRYRLKNEASLTQA